VSDSTTSSSVASSVNLSPADTPRPSPSSTSLSSLASEEFEAPSKLVDTLGNPFSIPDYTIGDIHKAIPKHCFERSAACGLGYVARDVVSLAVTFYVTNQFVTPEFVPSMAVRAGLWAVYTVVQGLFGTGLWVLAHECGHQSFSPSKTLNDTVGWICHSALLVPYFSWKISHGKHHKATGHMERDMVFVPKTRKVFASRYGYLLHEMAELTEETPIATAFHLLYQQLGGWPVYLMSNVTGHNNHEKQVEGRGKGKANGFGGGVNHFNPSSPLYESKDAKLIVLSDLGLFIVGSILFTLGQKFGWMNLLVWYFVPYLWVNHWLGKSCNLTSNPHANTSQLPSLSFNIPILPYRTTLQRLGPTLAVRLPQSIVNLGSLVGPCCTASSRPMFFTTMLARFHSTTPMRRPRRSSLSWDNTTGVILRMAVSAS
jgi:omega-6 fatty acid desaturase / acyl-lipid omega-6 desaturase (Delta-12 desaturase)